MGKSGHIIIHVCKVAHVRKTIVFLYIQDIITFQLHQIHQSKKKTYWVRLTILTLYVIISTTSAFASTRAGETRFPLTCSKPNVSIILQK